MTATAGRTWAPGAFVVRRVAPALQPGVLTRTLRQPELRIRRRSVTSSSSQSGHGRRWTGTDNNKLRALFPRRWDQDGRRRRRRALRGHSQTATASTQQLFRLGEHQYYSSCSEPLNSLPVCTRFIQFACTQEPLVLLWFYHEHFFSLNFTFGLTSNMDQVHETLFGCP